MNEIPFDALIRTMQTAGPEVEAKVLASCVPAIRLMSVSGAKKGISDGVDIHGRPYAPLKHQRPNGGDKPLRDKGLLAASISATTTEKEITLAANSPGARLQNYGGTVRPKKGKALAIPVSKEAKRVGSPGGGRFPRTLFYCAAASATVGLLAENVDGDIVVHYVLVPSVVVPARQFLGWSAETLGRIGQLVSDRYAKELANLFRSTKV